MGRISKKHYIYRNRLKCGNARNCQKKTIYGEWIHSDILDFNLNERKFDLILSTHDTLNYLRNEEELKKVFSKVQSHLEPEGLFFFDLSSLYNFKNHFDGQTFVERIKDYTIEWKNRFIEDSRTLESTLIFSHKSSREKFSEIHKHKHFLRNTIHNLFQECGFILLEEGSDYKNWILEEGASLINYLCRNSEMNLRNP